MTRPLTDALAILEHQPPERYTEDFTDCPTHPYRYSGDRCQCPRERMCAVTWLADQLKIPEATQGYYFIYTGLAREFGTTETFWSAISGDDCNRDDTLTTLRRAIEPTHEVLQ